MDKDILKWLRKEGLVFMLYFVELEIILYNEMIIYVFLILSV